MAMVGNFLPSPRGQSYPRFGGVPPQELHEIPGDGAIFRSRSFSGGPVWQKKLGDGANFVERSSPKQPLKEQAKKERCMRSSF
jgi:hypothetical protein